MDHVAILNKKQANIDHIVNGVKSIESRWYKIKTRPWDRINQGDTVYFKYTGKPVTVKATVEKVLQYDNLNAEKALEILTLYGKQIDLQQPVNRSRLEKYQYCILLFLKNPRHIEPFHINKTGFGNAAAWITIENIESIKLDKKEDQEQE